MNNPMEQITELQRNNLDSAMHLAQLSIDNSTRIMELQTELARTLFNDGIENAKALTTAADAQQVVELRARYAQESAQKMVAAAQEIASVSKETGEEFSRLLQNQGTGLMNPFQSFFRGLPEGQNQFADVMKKTVDSANAAFEQMAEASSSVFGGPSSKATPKSSHPKSAKTRK